MSKVYFISGLGADWRMFQFLKLPDHIPVQQVNWIEPLSFDEPLQDYAKRLLPQIDDPRPILVGFSFGGLVAMELAKMLHPVKTIAISSLATCHDLPWYYKMAGKMLLHKYVPFKVMQNTYPVAPFFFGAQSPYERRLLKSVFFRINEKFLRWALARLLDWKQDTPPAGLIQIHGTSDKVLPIADMEDVIKIPRGEHLMVIHRAEEVSAILSRILLDCTHDEQK
ncbi:pimeloyl-ACP methyl ester carboxylesterase [Pontibacter aydingkolensis]|uniref:Alpha/beta hydrolase n=1 Tax=Pontibacter aydingkolensis TaxID=1911536 RepID=A0ABS7CYK1_9BACT|nr:alpha/beta hydrolase [Pontibacter aydingkolensis]MBW7468883.1 alpha/beta hydrolase [Pontibacter aydingkolensis]